jgi:pimeloyl-ACP methyl ester carboxylesterase
MDPKRITLPNESAETVYFRGGSGEPVLYLHHLAGMQGWEPVHEQLSRSFDVIAPYQPGAGHTAGLEDFDTGLDLVLHYRQLLDSLGIERAHILGHSIGAWIGAEIAAIQPDRVNRAVLVNPLGLWDDSLQGEDPYAQPPMGATAVLLADPDRREELILKNGTIDPTENYVLESLDLKCSAKYLWPVPDTGVSRRLPLIKAPTLIITSSVDRVVPAEYGKLWKNAIAGASEITIDGAGHLVNLEQPDRLAALAGKFLGGAE